MNEKKEEQLILDDVSLDAVEHSEICDENSTIGSSKFKSTEELLKAYENLEKEFTKKCQKLSALCCDNKESLPQQKNENWLEKMNEFLEKNEQAKGYVKQITEILARDENLAKKDDALDVAYSMVLRENLFTKEQLANDEKFLEEFVYDNEKVKERILRDFVLSLKNNQNVPLIGSDRGSLSVSSPKYKPKDLKEAGLFAQHILKK